MGIQSLGISHRLFRGDSFIFLSLKYFTNPKTNASTVRVGVIYEIVFVFKYAIFQRICIYLTAFVFYLNLALIFEIFDQIHSNTGVFFASTTELYCSFMTSLKFIRYKYYI